MSNRLAARLWFGRLKYALTAGLLILFGLVPLGFTPGTLPRPDLLGALTFAFLLRRPDFLPVWLIALTFLLADILEMRPPGLWTAVMLLATRAVAAQEYRFRELVFPFEWAFVTAVIFLALLANRVVLSLTMVPVDSYGQTMLHFLATVLAYPLVVLFCHYVLAVRKITPELAIRYGHRL